MTTRSDDSPDSSETGQKVNSSAGLLAKTSLGLLVIGLLIPLAIQTIADFNGFLVHCSIAPDEECSQAFTSNSLFLDILQMLSRGTFHFGFSTTCPVFPIFGLGAVICGVLALRRRVLLSQRLQVMAIVGVIGGVVLWVAFCGTMFFYLKSFS